MSGALAIPRFEPEVYFAQRLEAYGVFVDRSNVRLTMFRPVDFYFITNF